MRLAPIKRALDLVLLVGLIVVVAWTFQVKQESQEALERVAELEKQIAAEKTEIDLLKSDWSLLTNPARLQELFERYSQELDLAPIDAMQLADGDALNQLPKRSPAITDLLEGFAEIDSQSTTASVPDSGGPDRGGAQ